MRDSWLQEAIDRIGAKCKETILLWLQDCGCLYDVKSWGFVIQRFTVAVWSQFVLDQIRSFWLHSSRQCEWNGCVPFQKLVQALHGSITVKHDLHLQPPSYQQLRQTSQLRGCKGIDEYFDCYSCARILDNQWKWICKDLLAETSSCWLGRKELLGSHQAEDAKQHQNWWKQCHLIASWV